MLTALLALFPLPSLLAFGKGVSCTYPLRSCTATFLSVPFVTLVESLQNPCSTVSNSAILERISEYFLAASSLSVGISYNHVLPLSADPSSLLRGICIGLPRFRITATELAVLPTLAVHFYCLCLWWPWWRRRGGVGDIRPGRVRSELDSMLDPWWWWDNRVTVARWWAIRRIAMEPCRHHSRTIQNIGLAAH